MRDNGSVEVPLGEMPDQGVVIGAGPDGAGRTRVRAWARPLGAVQLGWLSLAGVHVRRTTKLVRRNDPGTYLVGLVTSGTHSVEQFGSRAVLGPGHLSVFDGSAPFDVVAPRDGAGEQISVHVPKHLLPDLTDLCARSMPATSGPGRLLAQFLVGLAEEMPSLGAADVARLSTIAVDLAAAALTARLGRDTPPESAAGALFCEVVAFVQRELADPALSPTAIASAHHISVRYLHRIFQVHGTTPGAFLTDQRVRRCRRDLADPALARLPVHAIGARWGYPHPARFSRVFRDATGVTPGEYRRLSQTGR